MDKKTGKKLFWAILFSVCFVFFLMLRVDWQHFPMVINRLNVKDLLISLVLFICANLVRALRFYRLDHIGKSLLHWWNINAFYNFITATLPGGGGEAATVYVIKRFSEFNVFSALRILLFSRFMDIFALSMLFLTAAVSISSLTPYREVAIWLSSSLFLLASIALLRSSEQFILKLVKKFSSRGIVLQNIYEKLFELAKMAEEQRGNRSFIIALIQSVFMMIAAIVSIHFALLSFGVDFTVVQSFYGFGVYAIFQIVPIQGFAGIGTQAAWWTLALNAAGYRDPDTIVIGFILHAVMYIFITILGITSFLAGMLRDKSPGTAG